MARDVCSECGDTKPLTPEGVCAWRHGCEHRQMVHEATIGRLLAEMDAVAWHNTAREHAQDLFRGDGLHENVWDYASKRHPSFRAISGNPEQINRWLDRFLKGDEDDDGS